MAGVLFYGAIGWGLSAWLHAPYWIPIGILVGAVFGMYMVFARYRYRDSSSEPGPTTTPIRDGRSTDRPTAPDDRGETE